MEAVSLAASIAGLVTLADLVFRAAVKYHKSVKDAPKEVEALVDEVKDLSLLLHNLSLVEYGLAAQPDPAAQANARPPKPLHLQQCQKSPEASPVWLTGLRGRFWPAEIARPLEMAVQHQRDERDAASYRSPQADHQHCPYSPVD
ncbi:hypothetical protein BKA59DRAFT_452272 [Fusarium tricinctum]|uniref:Fungal N-terminal domain-containing protein n=1 Tax=Fusarium tricinctum TaxID=61284 RepID=A0A8K0RZX0_9HYPO|nr:hypothetical protein BKA59DRAFT_452272 [Fusarium tricinctum]